MRDCEGGREGEREAAIAKFVHPKFRTCDDEFEVGGGGGVAIGRRVRRVFRERRGARIFSSIHFCVILSFIPKLCISYVVVHDLLRYLEALCLEDNYYHGTVFILVRLM